MPQPEEGPTLSVVVLTRNEEANVADALDSLLAQEGVDLEVIVVDSASTDRTLAIAREYEARSGGRVWVCASAWDIPIGEARNLGIDQARGRIVAQMSADATASPGWAAALAHALEGADLVFGYQEHAPARLSPAAIVRGLRYHHFSRSAQAAPETYASNVNAAARREVLERVRYVDDGPASALDDVLFAREARTLGFRIAYEPAMVVRHKDATTLAGEWRKNRREGYGWGILRARLGLHKTTLAWCAALVLSFAALAAWTSIATALLFLGVLYAPTLRRLVRGGGSYVRRAPVPLAAAALASPLFDVAFAYHYLLGLLSRKRELSGMLPPGGHTA